MENDHLSKETSFSSDREHDPRPIETQARVHYEIIDTNIDNGRRRPKAENMTKDNNSRDLEDNGSTTNVHHNDTVLKRFKRKFSKKSSKADKEKGSVRSPETSRERRFGSRTSSAQEDHIYEVPFSNSTDVADNSEQNEHIYENGSVWGDKNVSKGNSEGARNRIESDKENRPRENGAIACGERRVGFHQVDTNNDRSASTSRKERWQQGKCMSLPAARVSSRQSSQFSTAVHGSANGSIHKERFCDASREWDTDEQSGEPLSYNHQTANNLIRTRSLPVPSRFNISHQFIAGLNDLCKCGWYWGPLSSKEAEVKLHGKPDGTFLVRDSNDNRYLLSLSFRSKGRTLHTRIEFCKGKFSFYAAPFISSGCHESIMDLIEDCVNKSKERVFCYSKGRGHDGAAFPVRLMKSLSRFEHVCSLQHLCRFVIRQHFTLDRIGDMPLPGIMIRYLGKNHFDEKQN